RVTQELIHACGQPFKADMPLAISATFYVKRPKGHFGTGRNADTIKPQFVDARPTGKPDLSNLLKLVEDGCKLGGLFPDDDQIVEVDQPLRKVYTQTREEQPRSIVTVRSLA